MTRREVVILDQPKQNARRVDAVAAIARRGYSKDTIKNTKGGRIMQPETMIEKTTAVIDADASEDAENVARAISIVLSANEEQMEKILEILFS